MESNDRIGKAMERVTNRLGKKDCIYESGGDEYEVRCVLTRSGSTTEDDDKGTRVTTYFKTCRFTIEEEANHPVYGDRIKIDADWWTIISVDSGYERNFSTTIQRKVNIKNKGYTVKE